ncbi:MAG: hypothetical protein KF841_14350 [Phycisphaerae bacterium]|nr:hypothetical protein [Phycisphaerae bacterium]
MRTLTQTAKQPALPGLQTAAADAARSASHLRDSWTRAECDFALRCIEVWNEAFANFGIRANKTKHNMFLAVHALKWISGPLNDGEKMSAEDVLVAIRAYAADPWIKEKCNGRFLAFPDWMKDAVDKNIDKQLARVGKRRGHAAPSPAEIAEKRQSVADRVRYDKAMAFITDRGWLRHVNTIASTRTDNPPTIREYLSGLRAIAARGNGRDHKKLHEHYDILIGHLDAIEALPKSNRKAWAAIMNYALGALRPMKDSPIKVSLRLAIAAELVARFGVERAAQIASKQPIQEVQKSAK